MSRTHCESPELMSHGTEDVKQVLCSQRRPANPIYEILCRRHINAQHRRESNGCRAREDDGTFRKQPGSRVRQSKLADLLCGLVNVLVLPIADLPHVCQAEPRNRTVLPVLGMLTARRVTRPESGSELRPIDFPMRRDLPTPLDAGVLHGDVRIEAFGDRASDERRALLREELDQALVRRD